MKLLIDADACPVIDIALSLCREAGLECILFCDTAHRFERESAQTMIIDKGTDSVDFALVNHIQADDIVITQDYGLAAMCLARSARVLHQDGWEYTPHNMDALLLQRHESRKYRAAGGRTMGPKKRTSQQDAAFAFALKKLI